MLTRIENKRLFPRVDTSAPIHYEVRGSTLTAARVAGDISAGGLSFIDQQYIPPATLLNLEVNLLSRVIRPAAKVCWVAPLPHSYRFRVGVQFLEMDPEEKRYLSDYIDMRRDQF